MPFKEAELSQGRSWVLDLGCADFREFRTQAKFDRTSTGGLQSLASFTFRAPSRLSTARKRSSGVFVVWQRYGRHSHINPCFSSHDTAAVSFRPPGLAHPPEQEHQANQRH
jgi:hypothetical protein